MADAAKTPPKVVVVGSLVFDLVARVDRRPGKGETRLGTDFGMFPGGKGANQAVQAARFCADVTMVGQVGDDFFGREMIKSLHDHYVDTRFVHTDPSTTTAVGCITVDETGDNSIVVVPQANMKFMPAQAENALNSLLLPHTLLLQLEIPLETNIKAAVTARSKGWPVILNPAPAQPLPDQLLRYVDYLTPNEIELGAITGSKPTSLAEYARAAGELLSYGIKGVIVTLGEQGAMLVTEDESTLFPAFHVAVVDTTAAGDAFTGTFSVAMAEGKPLHEAIVLANAAGALAATRSGAQPSLADRDSIEKLAVDAKAPRSII